MNIIEAAKAMQEGKRIRRLTVDEPSPFGYRNPDALQLDTQGFIVCVCHGQRIPWLIPSLLADDWVADDWTVAP